MTRELRYYETIVFDGYKPSFYSFIYSEDGKVVSKRYYADEFDFPNILMDLVIDNREKGSLRVIKDKSIVEPLEKEHEEFQRRHKELSNCCGAD